MSAPKGADITDAVTRSAIVLLFKQFVLATPKTRSLTITIGDIKITSPPVQHTHWQAARGQPDPRRFSSGQQQGHRVHNAKQRRSANRAAERAGQPPPYPKPSMAKEEQAAHPGMPAPAAPPPAQPAAPPPAPPAPPPVPDVEYPDLGASIYHEAPSALPDEEATDEEDEPTSPQVDLGQSIYHEARAPSESGELSN